MIRLTKLIPVLLFSTALISCRLTPFYEEESELPEETETTVEEGSSLYSGEESGGTFVFETNDTRYLNWL